MEPLTKSLAGSTHASWKAMRYRCDNPACGSYPRYGGAGVTYDPRWKDFETFLEDMGLRPTGMTLERRDNSQPYCKDNCIWATPKQQANNRSSNVFVTYAGARLTLKQWAERTNIKYVTIKARYRAGHRDEQLFRKPARHKL